MKWFKHISDSLDDPDLHDAIEIFGSDGYMVFFRVLEIMSREYDEESPGIIEVSVSFLKKKIPISFKKVIEILKFFDERGRILHEFFNGNRLDMIRLNCPKLKELSDNFTKQKLRSKFKDSENNVSSYKEVEEDKEKEKNKRKPLPSHFDNSDFKHRLAEFKEFRSRVKAPLTDRAFALLIPKLEKLSGCDSAIACQILDQSIYNGWKGVFELKSKKSKNMPPVYSGTKPPWEDG